MKENLDMIVTIANFKGGGGKSMTAHSLIANGWQGVDLDPYGNLKDRFPDDVVKLELHEQIPDLKGLGRVVIDTGGYHDKRMDYLIPASDLLVVPFIATGESLQATIDTLNRLKPSIPVLFVVNMHRKAQNLQDSMDVLSQVLGYKAEYVTVPFSDAIQTAINENMGFIQMAERGGLAGYAYRPIANVFIELEKKIMSFNGKRERL